MEIQGGGKKGGETQTGNKVETIEKLKQWIRDKNGRKHALNEA